MPQTEHQEVRKEFLGWQCRIRQIAMRRDAGRPSSGMRAVVFQAAGGSPAGEATTLIIKRDSEEITAQFRYMYQKTTDPADRYDAVLRYVAAGYYQEPLTFASELTALFGPLSDLADAMLAWRTCRLEFGQFSQGYALSCQVRQLDEADPGYQATFWHNSLFNSSMPPGVRILGLTPDWNSMENLDIMI